ncbi:MAG: FKBP-type peptidyl-prolyl cis-trans isomerase [bacterium]|nr:FKBP-type peptidyl-prolyl cis-trans isomerase [bacterium]
MTTSSLSAADDDVLKTQTDKASYAIGHNIGSTLTKDGLNISLDQLFLGLKHAMTGKDPLLTQDEMEAALIAEQKALEERAMAEQKKIAADNQKKADDFLAENKKKKGIITTESGLQYEVVAKGDGPSPKETDTVKAHYHGTLLDESVFDSSINRKEPIVIPVNRVIPGWTEALTKMKVGDKWKLYIPPALAYGENPRPGGPIGPNELLIFDIELLSIEE